MGIDRREREREKNKEKHTKKMVDKFEMGNRRRGRLGLVSVLESAVEKDQYSSENRKIRWQKSLHTTY